MLNLTKVKKSVTASTLGFAVATAIGGAGISMSAQAVNIAPDGLGEALIYPYYSVRNGWAEYINVVNTSRNTVIFKIRVNEGENSRDARDFNVVLSPYDVWTAAIVPNLRSDSGKPVVIPGGRIQTNDNTCTVPKLTAIDSSATHPALLAPGVAFTDVAYSGKSYDNGSQGIDRTSEGYITIFEMGMIKQDSDGKVTGLTGSDETFAQKFVDAADHQKGKDASGAYVAGAAADDSLNDNRAIPADCSYIISQLVEITQDVKDVISEPENVLKGRAVLINSRDGVAQGYDPVVLANFYSPAGRDGASVIGSGNANSLMFNAGSTKPSLNEANPAVANYMDASSATLQTVGGPFAQGVDAVSALLARESIVNDYNARGSSSTDWLITFPTKAFYVDADVNNKGGTFFKIDNGKHVANAAPYAPFTVSAVGGETFAKVETATDKKIGKGRSCVNIQADLWDREEFNKPIEDVVAAFSPLPEDGDPEVNRICYEANVLSFGGSSNFYPEGSTTADYKLYHALFENDKDSLPGYGGWGRIMFTNAAASPSYTALPVVGMRLETRKNPARPLQFHGFSSQHAYDRGTIDAANFRADLGQ